MTVPAIGESEADRPAEPTVAAVVRAQTGLAWSRARRLCTEGRVAVNGLRCVDPAARVPPDAVVTVDAGAPKLRSGPLERSAIAYVDRDVVVIDKPAGMLTVADEPGNRDTLADYARTLLRAIGAPGQDSPLGVVHRLDRETSGLVAFARTPDAKRRLAAQFRAHDMERVYRAIAHGEVRPVRVETWLVPDRGDGLRGSHGVFRRANGPPPATARRSLTHVKPLASLAGATLVECRLETGRQHQIRIHLAELGHPVLGEQVYIRDYRGAPIAAPRIMLHARTLGFTHPRSARTIVLEREPPADFQAMAAALAPAAP